MLNNDGLTFKILQEYKNGCIVLHIIPF